MSFGDNYNDIPILSLVGHPYIMDNAVQELWNCSLTTADG